MKQFEKYGLTGAVTDFGQMLLLFTRRQIERYEFTPQGSRMIGYDRALVFAYKQIDGPEALTLFEENKHDQVRQLKSGRRDSGARRRLRSAADHAGRPTGRCARVVGKKRPSNYAMSKFGALLPASTEHRELRDGKVVAENQFSYTDFHKFGASSESNSMPK